MPMATHAKDRVRADLAQEGITVDESKIVERLKKALVGQQRSRFRRGCMLCASATNHLQAARNL